MDAQHECHNQRSSEIADGFPKSQEEFNHLLHLIRIKIISDANHHFKKDTTIFSCQNG